MAGNKINTKAKGKDDKVKVNKGAVSTNEENEDYDFSLLRKPILTSITGFAQARKIFDMATEELKGLLSNECDILYECKVCRNIFRSLANFISHKRVYCKESFNTSVHGHFIKASSTASEILRIKRLEEDYHKSMKDRTENEQRPKDTDGRIPMTKDITAIIENIAKSRGEYDSHECQNIILENIPNSSVAVFQNFNCNNNTEEIDNMQAQVKELDNILSRDKAVLLSDGKFEVKSSLSPEKAQEAESVIQISDDDENDSHVLKCKICNLQFSTQKTLKFHIKYKHLESRLVYPCPDCLEIFSTSWSVYRHLFKVHRKTAAQIRRLRESIQAKAFKMNNPPAFYEKRKNNLKSVAAQKISEEERLDQENQAWMDNMEGDGELPRCGGCGRTFERRAALAAHTHTCQPRSRALARRPQETKRIEIQIRKDYNKGPSPGLNLNPKNTDTNGNKVVNEDTQSANKLHKENENFEEENNPDEDNTEDMLTADEDDQKPNDRSVSPKKIQIKFQLDDYQPTINLPYAQHLEKNNLVVFKQKMQPDIILDARQCMKCEVKLPSVKELYDHMADHYKWMRYACKLCNFKHYDFEKLPEHVKVVHKLKGDTDFYFSTVKAIDGNQALELCETTEEQNDANETSPESRRPSRCSSDSSRISDDSSSSSTRFETGARKRKLNHTKNYGKRRKEALVTNVDRDEPKDDVSVGKESNLTENETSSNTKTYDENSSDMDDIDEKIAKRRVIERMSSVASRRPVRKRTMPKNEDFEYDLSNLLKLEAQGYRDSQSVTTIKNYQGKKKVQQDTTVNYESINKDCCGALETLSKKAVESKIAHMKASNFTIYSVKDIKPSNIFVRPMIPRILCRGDKLSPKKDVTDDSKDSPSKVLTTPDLACSTSKEVNDADENEKRPNDISDSNNEKSSNNTDKKDTPKTKQNVLPSVVPLKFRRQSLEVINNPIINKNITEFTKAGMKTKILVIKPINRNKEGGHTINAPLKFQTIKLKDPNKLCTKDKPSDQVVVVKVPKVDTVNRSKVENLNKVTEKVEPNTDSCANTENVIVEYTTENISENTIGNESTKSSIQNTETNEVQNTDIVNENSSGFPKSTNMDVCEEDKNLDKDIDACNSEGSDLNTVLSKSSVDQESVESDKNETS